MWNLCRIAKPYWKFSQIEDNKNMATHFIFGEPGHPQVHGGDESNALAKGTDEPISDRNPWQTLKKEFLFRRLRGLRSSNDDFFDDLLWNHKRMPFSDNSYISYIISPMPEHLVISRVKYAWAE